MSDFYGDTVKYKYGGSPAMTETGPATAVKTPEIEKLWRELENESNMLLENLKSLEIRLQPVLLPDAPQVIKPDAQASPRPPHSSLYTVLDDLRYRITGASILVNQIMQRLEI